jgi:hypothetical protein
VSYDIFTNFNNVDDALAHENYYTALFNAVRMIPAVDDIIDGCESLFTLVYSKAFMTAMYNSCETQLRLLDNCSNCLVQKNELENLQNIASDQLYRLQREELNNWHSSICTCH